MHSRSNPSKQRRIPMKAAACLAVAGLLVAGCVGKSTHMQTLAELDEARKVSTSQAAALDKLKQQAAADAESQRNQAAADAQRLTQEKEGVASDLAQERQKLADLTQDREGLQRQLEAEKE